MPMPDRSRSHMNRERLCRSPLRWIFLTICYPLSGIFQTCLAANPDTLALPAAGYRNFAWGISVHPLAQRAYFDNIDQQIGAIKRIGLSFYRVDIIPDSSGLLKDSAAERRLMELAMAAEASHVALIPAILLPDDIVLY